MSTAARTETWFVGSWRLAGFIAASVTAHCLLLDGWTDNALILPLPSRLEVTVIGTKETDQPATENARGPATTRHDHEPVRHVAETPDTATTTNGKHSSKREIPAAAETAPTQPPAPAQDDERATSAHESVAAAPASAGVKASTNPVASLGQIKKRIDEQLHNNLARHFHYPALAQRRNWQGEVRLGLRVESNGQLSHIRVVKSSGYAILDEAALASLRQVTTIPQAGHWLRGKSFDTVLPVKYRLLDS